MPSATLQTKKWRQTKLGDFVVFNYGKGLPERDRVAGPYPVYGSAGVVDTNKDYLVEGPGVVVGRKGSVGEIYYTDKNYFPIDTVYYITKGEKYNLRFLYYLLKTVDFKSLNSDAAVPGLNRNTAYAQEVLLPKTETQEQIADVLSTYDDLIENNTKRIKILEEIAQTTYREWFVYFRFPGHEKVRMIDPKTEFGKIPEGWEVKNVGDLLAKISRKPKIKKSEYEPFGTFPVIDQGQDFIGGCTSNTEAIYEEGLPIIIFGDHTRVLKFIDFPFACGADGTQLLSSNSERMPNVLFFYNLRHIDLSNYAYARHLKFLKAEKILLPDAKIAIAFSDLVSPLHNLTKDLLQNNIKLRQARDLLLPKLVTGEVGVK